VRRKRDNEREPNRTADVSTDHTPPLGAKAHGDLCGILHGPEKASPVAWVDAKPEVKPQVKVFRKTRPDPGLKEGGRERPSLRGALG
jgi:hypothetical protein